MANPWKPGQSGNPNGRPKKQRAWTALLDRAGSHTILPPDGTPISAKRFIARALVELATHGKTKMADGTEIEVRGDGWFDVVKFIYAQVDGPPKAEVDLTSNGETLTFGVQAVDYRTGLDAIAPGSIRDSDTPGDDEGADRGTPLG
jgi:hypothetical protein